MTGSVSGDLADLPAGGERMGKRPVQGSPLRRVLVQMYQILEGNSGPITLP